MLLRPLLLLYQGKSTYNKMTITADLRPTSPTPVLPEAFLPKADLTKLYMMSHKSCPELQAESVISSSDEEASVGGGYLGESSNDVEDSSNNNVESTRSLFGRLETFDEDKADNGPFSMDDEEGDTSVVVTKCSSSKQELQEEDQALPSPARIPSMSSPPLNPSSPSTTPLEQRRKLQWEFKGLTLWLELEEFDNDLTRAVEDFSSKHSSPWIPQPHTTAIYGMEHLSHEEASRRLHMVKDVLTNGTWPSFAKPTGVTSDIAVCGRPGQVCSIAWSELTLASNDEHENALDALYNLFYSNSVEDDSMDDEKESSSSSPRSQTSSSSTTTTKNVVVEMPQRHRPWKPHNSIAYDNPETNTLSLLDTITYMSVNPTLLGCERRVQAISLWSTAGKMEEWSCIDRVKFF